MKLLKSRKRIADNKNELRIFETEIAESKIGI